MKRFFTKSKVAFFIVISIAVFCFGFNTVKAELTPSETAEWNTLNAKSYNTLTSAEKTQILKLSKKRVADDVYNADGSLNPNATPEQLQAAANDIIDIEDPLKLTPTQQAIVKYYDAVQAGDPNAYTNNITPLLPAKDPSYFDIIKNAAGQIIGGAFTGLANIVAFVIEILLELVTIPIASIFLAIAGKLLDYVIQFTINGASFTAYMAIINNLWVLVRDIFNVAFIFILLYIAISKILGSLGPKAKSTLKSVIISAVLINFSFFVTRIIIDSGNIVAMALYSQIENNSLIKTQNLSTSGFTNGVINGVKATSTLGLASNIVNTAKLNPTSETSIYLSEILANNLGIQSIWSDTKNLPSLGTEGLVQSFLRLTIILITTFVFFWMVFLLLGRFVMLMFLMVSAPIGFVGGSIPWVKKYSDEWWETLTNQTVLAPIFMFLMLLILQVAIQSNNITGKGDAFMIYFKYILIIYLLFKAVEITKDFSGKIGGFANKMASAASGVALGVATGGTAFIARQTLGRTASAFKNSTLGARLESATHGENIITSSAAKLVHGGVNKVATGTMDVRNTLVGKQTLDTVRSEGGINIAGDFAKPGGTYGKGKEAKGGFEGWKDQQRRDVGEKAKAIDKSSKDFEGNIETEIKNMEAVRADLEQKVKNPNTEEKDKEVYGEQIVTLDRQITEKKENSPEAMEKKAGLIVDTKPEISNLQKDIARRTTEKAELDKKLEEVRQQNQGPNVSPEDKEKNLRQIADLEEEIKKQETGISNKQEEYGKLRSDLINAEMSDENSELTKTNKVFKAIAIRRNMRKRFANQLRTRIVSSPNKIFRYSLGGLMQEQMSGREDQNLAGITLNSTHRDKTPEEKEKERINREAAEKAAREYIKDNPPAPAPTTKP